MPREKLTIEFMNILAKERGGKFISNEYINARTKHKWQCKNNHVWEAIPDSIQRGSWCLLCYKDSNPTTNDMHSLAKERKGKFLSDKYIGALQNYKWECVYGHIWDASPSNIKRGGWCPHCAGMAKLTIKDMHLLAEKMNGKFLSNRYINALTKYKWACSYGHIWYSNANNIRAGAWCRKCKNERQKLTIEDMIDLAKTFQGKFISDKYVGSHTKHEWECSQGHIWKAQPNNIQNGTWCPHCVIPSRGEEICRIIISKMFGEIFIKCRPDFLKNKNNLELDGFCEKLNLAFEYHGLQHFEPVRYWGGEETLKAIQERDKLKLELCAKAGIKLIIVPTFPISFDKLICQHMIELAVIDAGIDIPPTWSRAIDSAFP